MASAPVPETDLARVRRWCSDAVPPEAADQVRVELHRRGISVTLCESRPPWGSTLTEWDHLPVAQLRFRPEQHDWSLHWADRNSRWHPYDHGNRQFGSVAELSAEIDDPTAIFKGCPGHLRFQPHVLRSIRRLPAPETAEILRLEARAGVSGCRGLGRSARPGRRRRRR